MNWHFCRETLVGADGGSKPVFGQDVSQRNLAAESGMALPPVITMALRRPAVVEECWRIYHVSAQTVSI